MTSLKRNKALNIRTIAKYIKEAGGGEVKSFDSFSQPLPPKIVSATLVLRRNIKGAVSRNSAKLGNYKMPVKLRET